MTLRYSTDIVIFGGGVAGLWLLNRLRSEGYCAILLENSQIGAGQTLASQGIIHGGLKYALGGALTGAADTIASMPQRWRDCLAGNDQVDLRGCKLLSDHYFMWSSGGIRSKLKTFLGSKSLRGRVESVGQDDYPEFFQQASIDGTLYQLPDFVIETESLLATLTKNNEDRIFAVTNNTVSFQRNTADEISTIEIETAQAQISIQSQRLVFAAGKGNQQLIESSGLEKVRTQLRPLNMVFLKQRNLPSVYVHCIGNSFSLTPKLTVTSHQDTDGCTVWYLGGEIAESGVGKSRDQQLQEAQSLVKNLFPWIDIKDADWDCFVIDRAEPAVSSNYRPDDAYLVEEHGVLVAWPTKLTLTPSLGDKLISHLHEQAIEPQPVTDISGLNQALAQPNTAVAQWN